MSCFCDYESPEFYSKHTKKARVRHQCFECCHAISPGEMYEYVVGKWDGDLQVHKTCNRCVSLREHISAHVPCFCWAHGNMLDDARETVRSLPLEAIGSGLMFELGRMAVAIKNSTKFKATK